MAELFCIENPFVQICVIAKATNPDCEIRKFDLSLEVLPRQGLEVLLTVVASSTLKLGEDSLSAERFLIVFEAKRKWMTAAGSRGVMISKSSAPDTKFGTEKEIE